MSHPEQLDAEKSRRRIESTISDTHIVEPLVGHGLPVEQAPFEGVTGGVPPIRGLALAPADASTTVQASSRLRRSRQAQFSTEVVSGRPCQTGPSMVGVLRHPT